MYCFLKVVSGGEFSLVKTIKYWLFKSCVHGHYLNIFYYFVRGNSWEKDKMEERKFKISSRSINAEGGKEGSVYGRERVKDGEGRGVIF